MAIRGIWKYKDDKGGEIPGLTIDKDYPGFDVGGSVYVVTDAGSLRPINLCSPTWQLQVLNVDGETVYEREEGEGNGEGNRPEGGDAADAEKGGGGPGKAGEKGGKGKSEEGRGRSGQDAVV
jgi:hypothetical protein